MIENFTEAEKGYLAGIIDGEGSLMIDRWQKKNGNKVYIYGVQLGVYNTDKRLIDWVEKKLKNGYRRTEVSGEKHWKPRYRIIVSERNVIFPVLKMLIPYLIIKKERAKLILKLQKGVNGGNNRFLLKERKDREKLYQKIKKLNQRGIRT